MRQLRVHTYTVRTHHPVASAAPTAHHLSRLSFPTFAVLQCIHQQHRHFFASLSSVTLSLQHAGPLLDPCVTPHVLHKHCAQAQDHENISKRTFRLFYEDAIRTAAIITSTVSLINFSGKRKSPEDKRIVYEESSKDDMGTFEISRERTIDRLNTCDKLQHSKPIIDPGGSRRNPFASQHRTRGKSQLVSDTH
ncbi:hypothetical protein EDB87DRAFT_819570 [Lactarius vividus]|nr:hypothetical protein EDB87DRAFT_819570 [Lactarius vividus]